MKQNIKNPLAAGQAANVQTGRADSDFDAAKYTPAPLQSRPLPNEQWTQPAVGNPNVGIQVINDNVRTKHGPVFSNLILADEINRAPAKVQSALLEAMQERQVTLGDETYRLPDPFLVLATQNPLEQEGTYPLPEAQVDRFMMKVIVGYPNRTEERAILDAMAVTEPSLGVQSVVS